jgi:GNAT superfamily N-acetyltransferase
MDAPAELPDIAVDLVDLDATFALRKAVLRPWLTPEEAQATWAGTPAQFQVGALRDGPEGRQLVSTAGFLIEAHPDYLADFGPAPWRLRGMATLPEARGRGLGGRVLDFGIAEIARRLAAAGAASATLWCSGRTVAQRFYERHGFAAVGEVYETPGTGPHYVFWRRVEAGYSGSG